MSIVKTPLFIVLSLVATVAIASSNMANVEKRIQNAQQKFAQTVVNFPDKQVEAVAFFTNDMPLEDVGAAVSNTDIAVKGFRHGTQSYSGGYTLKPGETLDEAIVNYRQDHLFFLQKRMEVESNAIATEADENIRNALKTHRKEAEQMKQDFDKNGIRVVGVEFHGKAKDIQNFKKRNSFVRVVELKEKGKPQPAILPQ